VSEAKIFDSCLSGITVSLFRCSTLLIKIGTDATEINLLQLTLTEVLLTVLILRKKYSEKHCLYLTAIQQAITIADTYGSSQEVSSTLI